METVLQESILALTFNHERSSIIYLAQPSFQGENPINELIELDLHNQTVLERYIISKQLPNQPPFMLITSRRKGYLILAFQPSLMEIWQLGNSAQGFNQSIWSGETKGRGIYEIQHADVSNLDGILFFSAIDQRNIYCANIDDTIKSNGPELILSKLRLPERVNVNDLKCHPTDYKICSACSDGLLRVWNQTTYTQLKSIQDENNIIISLSFQQDGQKLLCGCDNGKILCYDAKTLGDRNILLAIYQLEQSHNNGILCLHWVNYNGAINCNQFLAYLYDGNIKLLNIKLLVPQDMIRDQKVSKSKKQELFGSIKEIQNLLAVKNDLKYNAQRQLPNVGLSKFIQIHPYANFISLNTIKTLPDQTLQSQIFYQYKTQIILLNDNTNLLAEYPVCSQQYQYSFKELFPDEKNRILTQRYLYYIDQHTMEIKQYCLAKGILKSIANLRQMILVENPIFHQLSVRPNSLNFAPRTQFLLSYKIETTYRCCTVMSNNGVLSDNLKEYPARFSMFLGQECWANPPLFLLYDDRSSYSIIFEDTLPQEEDMLKLLNKQDKDKLQNQMKQSLNLKVQRMFWTPLRSGFVVIYQPMNENILKFSRNRNSDNNLLDLLMQSGSEMSFKFGSDEQVTDLVWQKDQNIGAVVTIHNVYIVDDSLNTLKLISLQPQVNKKNRILLTYWMAQTLILQTKFHILYVLLNGTCASIQSIDNYEEKNVLSALLWDRMILLCQSHSKKQNNIEIKTKWINILQPILQGYIHNKRFFNQEVDESIVTKLLLTFANPNIDYSLIKDLEQQKQHIIIKIHLMRKIYYLTG
ncbi:unnamed protein product (macronuclear) [Paramecium tetraurelia]|uniref:Uncharacterized protein n=1 Tax=Paramecium tetraurelia TaxID=5888 RepID=A0DVH9_PARTE|nr:uncharacterized protein GSPATT00020699001 [Paramecium tetraurelia]CAK87046.1 unnamed protein product [Paramecium tetraurelia]|eukprot:XP_001454443.1 hypothetical protein (macronuclear) [Paramecium tetraurelia strain d4-2]